MDTELTAEANKKFPAPESFVSEALIKPDQYQALYNESLQNPEKFWGDIAKSELEWFAPWSQVLDWQAPHYRYFAGGKLNITYNCLDRHGKGPRRD